MQFALRPLASGIKMTMLLPAPPATKLKPAIPPTSGHLGSTTFFACNHSGVDPTTRSRQTHACRSQQSLCPMASALHADCCSAHKRHSHIEGSVIYHRGTNSLCRTNAHPWSRHSGLKIFFRKVPSFCRPIKSPPLVDQSSFITQCTHLTKKRWFQKEKFYCLWQCTSKRG